MIWLISKKFNPDNISIKREKVEKLVLIYSLKHKKNCVFNGPTVESLYKIPKAASKITEVLTSGLRLETRTVHLSFVPLIPGGKPPAKAAAIAAALAT